jgi:hypothetical protein
VKSSELAARARDLFTAEGVPAWLCGIATSASTEVHSSEHTAQSEPLPLGGMTKLLALHMLGTRPDREAMQPTLNDAVAENHLVGDLLVHRAGYRDGSALCGEIDEDVSTAVACPAGEYSYSDAGFWAGVAALSDAVWPDLDVSELQTRPASIEELTEIVRDSLRSCWWEPFPTVDAATCGFDLHTPWYSPRDLRPTVLQYGSVRPGGLDLMVVVIPDLDIGFAVAVTHSPFGAVRLRVVDSTLAALGVRPDSDALDAPAKAELSGTHRFADGARSIELRCGPGVGTLVKEHGGEATERTVTFVGPHQFVQHRDLQQFGLRYADEFLIRDGRVTGLRLDDRVIPAVRRHA